MELFVVGLLIAACLGVAPPTLDFAITVDAGSEGSRAYIFQWERRHAPGSVPPFSIPVCVGEYRTRPGISSYVNNPEQAVQSIMPLVEWAKDQLKDYRARLHEFPFYVKATAGMRVIKEVPLRDRIMETIRDFLSEPDKSPFKFQRTFARVISGEEEGVYGWLTVNFLAGTLLGTPVLDSYGALDLGGASTQITFRPPHDVLASYFPIRLLQEKIRLYSHSFLYMGYVEARKRVHEHLLNPTVLPIMEVERQESSGMPWYERRSDVLAFFTKLRGHNPYLNHTHHQHNLTATATAITTHSHHNNKHTTDKHKHKHHSEDDDAHHPHHSSNHIHNPENKNSKPVHKHDKEGHHHHHHRHTHKPIPLPPYTPPPNSTSSSNSTSYEEEESDVSIEHDEADDEEDGGDDELTLHTAPHSPASSSHNPGHFDPDVWNGTRLLERDGYLLNPCVPRGYKYWYTSKTGQKIRFKGGSDVNACTLNLMALLRKHAECWANTCSFAGQYQPRFDSTAFIAFSAFERVVVRDLELPWDVSLLTLGQESEKICNASIHMLMKRYPWKTRLKLSAFCFESRYIWTLLHKGFDFDLLGTRILWINEIKQLQIGWPLGSTIYEVNAMPWEIEDCTNCPDYESQLEEVDRSLGRPVLFPSSPYQPHATTAPNSPATMSVVSFGPGVGKTWEEIEIENENENENEEEDDLQELEKEEEKEDSISRFQSPSHPTFTSSLTISTSNNATSTSSTSDNSSLSVWMMVFVIFLIILWSGVLRSRKKHQPQVQGRHDVEYGSTSK